MRIYEYIGIRQEFGTRVAGAKIARKNNYTIYYLYEINN